jgi:hypothetical protein
MGPWLEEVQTVQVVQKVQTVEEHKSRYDVQEITIVEWWSRRVVHLQLTSPVFQYSSIPTIHSSQRF